MSLPKVLERGDETLAEYSRTSSWWNISSHLTCLATVGFSKTILNVFYKPELHGLEKLDEARERSLRENRGLMTVMNHMSSMDDPFLWGFFPWKYFNDVDIIRWGFGAENLLFRGELLSNFFSLGKILSCVRFGGGPFQKSVDAAIRLMSPDDTLGLLYDGEEDTNKLWKDYYNNASLVKKFKEDYLQPFIRTKPSWFHVFPEGYVLQLQEPFNNSMRYFKWGFTRMILESTRQPIVVPLFGHGFEKMAPETEADTILEKLLPKNIGAEIKVFIGDPIDDKIIAKYREEWLHLVKKYGDKFDDLTEELKFGKKAQDLRSRLAAEIRRHIATIRENEAGFPPEDPRFSNPKWWRKYTLSEGGSDPDVKFVGKNWAIRRYHGLPPIEEKKQNHWWKWW